MSALATLYTDISTTLYPTFSGFTIDVDLGQLTKTNSNIPLELPAILIKFVNVSWKDFDGSKMIGYVHIRLKLIYQLEYEYYFASNVYREEVAYVLAIAYAIQTVIDNMSPSLYSKMVRINENQGTTLENITMTYNMDYMTNIYSNDTDPLTATEIDYALIQSGVTAFIRAIDANRI